MYIYLHIYIYTYIYIHTYTLSRRSTNPSPSDQAKLEDDHDTAAQDPYLWIHAKTRICVNCSGPQNIEFPKTPFSGF